MLSRGRTLDEERNVVHEKGKQRINKIKIRGTIETRRE